MKTESEAVTHANNNSNLISRRSVCQGLAVVGAKVLGLTPSFSDISTALNVNSTGFFLRRPVVTRDGIMGLVDASITDGITSDTRIVRGLINDDHKMFYQEIGKSPFTCTDVIAVAPQDPRLIAILGGEVVIDPSSNYRHFQAAFSRDSLNTTKPVRLEEDHFLSEYTISARFSDDEQAILLCHRTKRDPSDSGVVNYRFFRPNQDSNSNIQLLNCLIPNHETYDVYNITQPTLNPDGSYTVYTAARDLLVEENNTYGQLHFDLELGRVTGNIIYVPKFPYSTLGLLAKIQNDKGEDRLWLREGVASSIVEVVPGTGEFVRKIPFSPYLHNPWDDLGLFGVARDNLSGTDYFLMRNLTQDQFYIEYFKDNQAEDDGAHRSFRVDSIFPYAAKNPTTLNIQSADLEMRKKASRGMEDLMVQSAIPISFNIIGTNARLLVLNYTGGTSYTDVTSGEPQSTGWNTASLVSGITRRSFLPFLNRR